MTIAPARLLTRFAVVGVETVAAVSAVGGGIGLAAGNAIGMPADWLAATPFSSWLVAGVLLLLVVAVPMGVAAVAELRRSSHAPSLALIAGALQVLWIIAQWVVIGRFHWLQPTMLVVGAAVTVLALRTVAARPRRAAHRTDR
jgi:hypothetical protein